MTDIPTDNPELEPQDPWDSEDGELIRDERNDRLSETDWMVLPDSPHQRNMEDRAHLWLYRKALRDITQTFASPEDVVWPELEGL